VWPSNIFPGISRPRVVRSFLLIRMGIILGSWYCSGSVPKFDLGCCDYPVECTSLLRIKQGIADNFNWGDLVCQAFGKVVLWFVGVALYSSPQFGGIGWEKREYLVR